MTALTERQARDAELVALYMGGATMEEIGQAVGLTRERVRQRIRRAGYVGTHRRGPDPSAVCRAAETALSLGEVARISGCCADAARRVLVTLGKWAAFKERCTLHRRMRTRAALLIKLRHLAARLGRTPRIRDINRTRGMSHPLYFRYFGSLRAAQIAAGLEPNPVGQPTPAAAIEGIRDLYASGLTINAISRLTGHANATVKHYVETAA